jgi:hypothetical protein
MLASLRTDVGIVIELTEPRTAKELGTGKFRFKISVKFEFAFNAAPLAWPDQVLMGVADGMQRAIEASLPELEELVHLGKVGGEVVILPDIGLQDGLKVRDVVKYVCGGEAIAAKLTLKI